MENQQPVKDNLKLKILNRIECDALCPKSRLLFQSRECVVWGLWLLTVVVGAVAVSVSFFVLLHHTYSLYEVTHRTFWSFFIETLPFLWLSVFLAMVIFAVYNLRHTKHGYRYPLWQILGSSLVLSLVGGVFLHLLGAGFVLDKQIGSLTRYYESEAKREQKIWQQPREGRLLGQKEITRGGDNNSHILTFTDQESVLWLTNISELDYEEVLLLESGHQVRLLGEVITISPPYFHACAVLPWLHDSVASKLELNNLRKRLISKSNRYLSSSADVNLSASLCVKKFNQLQFKSSL